jgi:energy-coupling factor transporter transmembrane protein EcfT
MIHPNLFYTWFIVGIIALLLVSIFTIAKYVKKQYQSVGLIVMGGIVLIAFVMAFLLKRNVYILRNENGTLIIHEKIIVLPEYDYTMPDGTMLPIRISENECVVINETETTYLAMEQEYSTIRFSFGGTENEKIDILPKEITVIPNEKIDYYFNQEFPATIEVQYGISESRWALRVH